MMTFDDALDRLRSICLSLPEATEGGGVGSPAFKVREKIFAMQHGMAGRPSVWFKAPRGLQAAMVGDDPAVFFVPPYVGVHGWIGAYLDVELDWDEVGDLVRDSYRMTAPKRLLRLVDANASA
jgi:predicted DNA-binding protein (MmcQ/YjbR family)